jgi:kynurenine formamidase
MCSPEIAKVVNERIQREGLPVVSRRNFLRLGGVTAAGLAVATVGAPRQALAFRQDMSEVIDLSHVLGTNVPTYVPTDTATRQTTVNVKDNGFYIQRWSFGEHTGTHVDIPAHFVADGQTADDYAANLLVSPAVVIDISAKAAGDTNAEVTVDDIKAWEKANGDLPKGALVCMYSGWETKWNDVPAFRGDTGDGKLNFPGFSGDAAKFLVTERDIHGIAVDTLSLDNGKSSTFDTHLTLLGAGKYGIENVANLKSIMGKKATVVVGLPRYEKGSGGPCRVLAMA